MPVTTDTEVFALRTLNKEQLIQKVRQLQENDEEINKLTLFATQKHTEFMERNTARIKKLEAEIKDLKTRLSLGHHLHEKMLNDNKELKNPVIHNRDSRCSQFDIRVGYSYIMECLEGVLLDEELDHFDEYDYQEKADFVCEEVARAIDGAINNYITNPVGQLEYHILDYVRDKVTELRDSNHIYEEYPGANVVSSDEE